MPNKAVYKGQWKGKMRHGYGVQVWPDGARYEGYWQNDKANGKGKFYHVEGDIYEGEWVNDKVLDLNNIRLKVVGHIYIQMVQNMKVNGRMIFKKVTELKHGKTKANILDIIRQG